MQCALLIGGPMAGTWWTGATGFLREPLRIDGETYLPHSGLVFGKMQPGLDGCLLAKSEFATGTFVSLYSHPC